MYDCEYKHLVIINRVDHPLLESLDKVFAVLAPRSTVLRGRVRPGVLFDRDQSGPDFIEKRTPVPARLVVVPGGDPVEFVTNLFGNVDNHEWFLSAASCRRYAIVSAML